MTANRLRVLSGAFLGVTAIAVLTAACTGTATVSANGTTVAVHASAGPNAPSSTPPATTTASTPHLFSSTSFTAAIDSYDPATQMLSFRVVKYTPGGPDDGAFAPDPSNLGHFQLPLADTMQIKAVLSLCPGISQPQLSGVACSKQQFVQALRNGQNGYADLHVDATGHIDAVSERYHP